MFAKKPTKSSLQLTWHQAVKTYLALLFVLPVAVLWRLITSPLRTPLNRRPWRRRIVEASFHAIVAQALKPAQMKLLDSRTTFKAYCDWANARKLPIEVEKTDHGGKLLWIGERGSEKVIFYMHGGGYLLPVATFALDYWSGVQQRLTKSGRKISIAMLEYSFSDVAGFPTQLKQAVAALKYLFQLGYQPSDIVLVGDSAGGNLIFQTLLHILRGHSSAVGVDPLILPSNSPRFAGALAVSPWLRMTGITDTGSYAENKFVDIINADGFRQMASVYLEGIAPASATSFFPYVDTAVSTPASWFAGIDTIVGRILITAGERETSRDDIVAVGRRVAEHHPAGTTIIVQEDGLHADVFLDMPLGQDPQVKLNDTIFEWLKEVSL